MNNPKTGKGTLLTTKKLSIIACIKASRRSSPKEYRYIKSLKATQMTHQQNLANLGRRKHKDLSSNLDYGV